MNHLFIATPCMGYVASCFLQSIIRLMGFDAQWQLSFGMVENQSVIQTARNTLAHTFLRSPATHLLFIDSDMKFAAEDIAGMVDANKDIIAGIAPKKAINYESVADAVKNNIPHIALDAFSGFFNIQPLAEVSLHHPFEVKAAGTGMMLVKRGVFDELLPCCEAYLDLKENAFVTDYFGLLKDEDIQLSEDFSFCHRWRTHCNGKVFADPRVRLGHYGGHLYQGQLV